jgi:hypothetical protein
MTRKKSSLSKLVARQNLSPTSQLLKNETKLRKSKQNKTTPSLPPWSRITGVENNLKIRTLSAAYALCLFDKIKLAD